MCSIATKVVHSTCPHLAVCIAETETNGHNGPLSLSVSKAIMTKRNQSKQQGALDDFRKHIIVELVSLSS